MSRTTLAFRCFFGLLFGGKLPADAAPYLPETARPALPEADRRRDKKSADAARKTGKGTGQKAGPKTGKDASEKASKTRDDLEAAREAEPMAEKADKADKADSAPPPGPAPSTRAADHHRDGALALLGLLQREGRLIDFLRESLDTYEDSDIGAAVRDIHRGCRKVLDDHLTIEPLMPGEQDAPVTVPRGFDPAEVRLIGEVAGEPPFRGTLRHHGWRVTRTSLPTLSEGVDRHVLASAEVEIES